MLGWRKRERTLWFKALLIAILEQLPSEYASLLNQVRDGIVGGVAKPGRMSVGTHPNYIGFWYDPAVVRRYEDQDRRAAYDEFLDRIEARETPVEEPPVTMLILRGISAYSYEKSEYVEIDLVVAHGLVAGLDSTVPMGPRTIDNTRVVIGQLVVQERS